MSERERGAGRGERKDKLIREREHDTYAARSKPGEPTVCPKCEAVFTGGRWQWADPVPARASEEVCPACRRTADRVPAGILTLGGGFFEEHREEIINLVRNKEENEKAEHPMKRIMEIKDTDEGTVITFTDTHLPRGVGDALKNAYEGELEIQYTDEAGIIRVNWTR